MARTPGVVDPASAAFLSQGAAIPRGWRWMDAAISRRNLRAYVSVRLLLCVEREKMLSGSALVRVAILVVVAALLATFVQIYWPSSGAETASETRPVPATPEQRNGPPAPEPPRPAPAPAPLPLPAETPTPQATTPAPSSQRTPPPVFEIPSRGEIPARGETEPAPIQDAAGAAADSSGPRALSVADLNTATLAELNGLQGGGSIGKAIVRNRPYASVDQLLSKRVLSKATYQRIKDQVTVR